MMLFGFFALVLVSVYWVNRAVVLFDRLIADGQSVGVFFEFTVLSLPKVIGLILPIACFAAATYSTNRLSNESELTVMQATGFSPWRLARPVFSFGLMTAILMAALSLYLVPSSLSQLDLRERQISENATARLLTEGTFLHPRDGTTFYIREISPEGVLQGVFLSDRSDPNRNVFYTADEAYLIKSESGPQMIMVDGLAQILNREDNRLFTTNFADFTYNISSLINSDGEVAQRLSRWPSLDLFVMLRNFPDDAPFTKGDAAEEFHGRIAQVLMCVTASLIGFATLMLGGFSRFGVWQQIVLAFAILVMLEAYKNGVADTVRRNADVWFMMYAPSAVGAGLIVSMLGYKANSHLFKKARRA